MSIANVTWATFRIEYLGTNHDVALKLEVEMPIPAVKKMIIQDLKANMSTFKETEIYVDWLSLYYDAKYKQVIDREDMPDGKKFYGRLRRKRPARRWSDIPFSSKRQRRWDLIIEAIPQLQGEKAVGYSDLKFEQVQPAF